MGLDRQLILHHAFAVLNELGLEGLTLRRLAGRLNVQAPAIYWHFKNKQELLDHMATAVLRESMRKSAALACLATWQEWATATHESLRETLLRYRDGAKMFSGTYLTDAELYAPMEANLRRFVAEGFTLRQSVVGLAALYSYTIGFVIEEQATQLSPGAPNPQYGPAEREKRVNKDLYPLAAAAGGEMFAHHETRFAEGLAIIVKGLEAIAKASNPTPRPLTDPTH
jgi:TetR/AcrR family transcriptional regulator, tetracycline repressor protein